MAMKNAADDGNFSTSDKAKENEKHLVKVKDKEDHNSFQDNCSSHTNIVRANSQIVTDEQGWTTINKRRNKRSFSKDRECGDDSKHRDKDKDKYRHEMKSSSSSKDEESESFHDKEDKLKSKVNEKCGKDWLKDEHENGTNKLKHNSRDKDKQSSSKCNDEHNSSSKSKDREQKDEDRKLKQYISSDSIKERSTSRILYLRNFTSWIRCMFINEYLRKVKDKKNYDEPIHVHDMCCGKGTDLYKWWKGNIAHLICSDMSSVALEHCKTLYLYILDKNYENNSESLYTIEYIAADCSRVRLREKYEDASMKLDIVSSQFRIHYSFESLPQAECMMKNAAECLQLGGYFIGTILDSNELLARVRKSDTNSFGNEVYNIIFECDTTTPPLFGAKYNFHLEGYVDSPEFLIYFPMLVKLAKKYGLKLVKKEKFYECYDRMKSEDIYLQTKMHCLETYPPPQGVELFGNVENDYEHAQLFLAFHFRNACVGTLSRSEWEAASKVPYL